MFKIPQKYCSTEIQRERIFPVFDKKIETVINLIQTKHQTFNLNLKDKNYPMCDSIDTVDLFGSFKEKFINQIENSSMNSIKNLRSSLRVDICLGCTNYIDNLYMLYGRDLQVLSDDYRYHNRLFPDRQTDVDDLKNHKPLLITFPFITGSKHERWEEILDLCMRKEIKLHIDAAWLAGAKDMHIDFSHPAIESLAISMSKGYGLGWNRIGLRFSKTAIIDSITLTNDFQSLPAINVAVGNFFLDHLEFDHMWKTHEHRYDKICRDFNLQMTNCIFVARENGRPVGVSSLIQYLEKMGAEI